jgi:hypothetical protein
MCSKGAGLVPPTGASPPRLCRLIPLGRGKTNSGAVCYDAARLVLKISDGHA